MKCKAYINSSLVLRIYNLVQLPWQSGTNTISESCRQVQSSALPRPWVAFCPQPSQVDFSYYVHKDTCSHAHRHTHKHKHAHTRTHTHTHRHTHTCTHAHTISTQHTHMHTCTYNINTTHTAHSNQTDAPVGFHWQGTPSPSCTMNGNGITVNRFNTEWGCKIISSCFVTIRHRPTHRLSQSDHTKQSDYARMEELPHHCCLLEQLHPLIWLQAVLGHFHSHLHTAHGGLPLPSVHVTKLPLPQGLPQMDRTSGKLLILVLGHLPMDLILSGTGAPKFSVILQTHRHLYLHMCVPRSTTTTTWTYK